MAKLDTLKERVQIRDIIRLGIALTCILIVIGGNITHSKNYIEKKGIHTGHEVEAIFSLKDFGYDVAQGTSTGVYNLKLESEKIGKLYTVDLSSKEISIELQLYEFVDENIDDYFEKILINEKIYHKKIYVHEKENYEEVIDGMEKIDEKKCNGCGACANAAVCPQTIIGMIPREATNFIPCSNSCDDDDAVRGMCGFGCIGCGDCVRACPEGAVDIIDNHAVINYDKCVGCGKCHEVCPVSAIDIVTLAN